MSVQYRYTDALAGDDRAFCRNDHAVFDLTPDTQRLLLGLFFLTADVRDDIANHFRPILKGLACAGDCLISRSNYFVRLILFPCSQHRCIALDGAVRLYCDETASSSQSLLLELDHMHVLRVDLRHYHRHVRSPTMSAVVGNYRSLCLCIRFLDGTDLILGHIYC